MMIWYIYIFSSKKGHCRPYRRCGEWWRRMVRQIPPVAWELHPWEIHGKSHGKSLFVRLGQEWTGKSQGPSNTTTQRLNSCFLTWYHISKMEKLRSTFHDLQELCASCHLEVERVTYGFAWKNGVCISSKWPFSSIFPFFRQTHILKHPHEV